MRSLDGQSKFFFWETADGSFTASLGEDGEWMHPRAGALSETRYVYGPAIERAFASPRPWVLSVGLGLAYVECLLYGAALRANRQPICHSFESDPKLREECQRWLMEEKKETLFTRTAEVVAQSLSLPTAHLIDALRAAYRQGRWRISGALDPLRLEGNFDAILYDAFSPRTSPELWSTETLEPLLESHTHDETVFATYAASGKLKRVLRAAGFTVTAREGFAGKRECTFAQRRSLMPRLGLLSQTGSRSMDGEQIDTFDARHQ